MKKSPPLYLALMAWILDAALVQCQQLTIQPEAGKQTVLSRADIDSLPHVKVTTHASETSGTFDLWSIQSVQGAPANYWTHLLTSALWDAQATTFDANSYIPSNKIPAIAQAVLAACDANDRVKDGILNDPRQCQLIANLTSTDSNSL
ncbi:MAG TPA: tannase/feruloyl esterase family alpha/beta hydrolase [Terriglobales bacterium]|nr:tannase/feruloyl esterase family alpha/beta hydrolase [Terriglobales bacterium]